ncbi:alpha/beta-hydrolase [Poronia punctata]|nr:alpha/beta-hydrolase [Poronia punctata]
MLDFLHLTYKHLYWRRPTSTPDPPPPGLTRTFINTPHGPLELLCAKPNIPQYPGIPSVFFAHGGMGSAWVWHEYMRHLARHGITSYAISTRGHGASWHPSFLQMVYATTKRALADDLVAGIKAVQEKEEGREVVLVGHSSGAGLCQFIVGEGDVRVGGIALLGAVPGTGSLSVYMNWWRLDPWFTIRMFFHGWHPNSPLSHPFLVKQAFFSNECPADKLVEFQSRLSRYESFLWPLGMFLRFVDPKRLMCNITGWGKSPRVLVMVGTEDKLMTREVTERTAEIYRAAFSELVSEKKLEVEDGDVQCLGKGCSVKDDVGHGVELAWVQGAGHHLQNDMNWEIGAEKLLEFVRRLEDV